MLPGIWETTGIIDASAFYGDDAWLFNVQAHPPTTSPPDTVKDGRLLLMTKGEKDKNGDDEDDD